MFLHYAAAAVAVLLQWTAPPDFKLYAHSNLGGRGNLYEFHPNMTVRTTDAGGVCSGNYTMGWTCAQMTLMTCCNRDTCATAETGTLHSICLLSTTFAWLNGAGARAYIATGEEWGTFTLARV